MNFIRYIPVTDVNGSFRYYKFDVTGDDTSTDFGDIHMFTRGVTFDLGDATGDDTMFGGGGNDTIEGGAGEDTLLGGAGSDQISAGGGNDRIVQDFFAGSDTIDGGEGDDTLDYSQSVTAGVNVVIDINGRTATRYHGGEIVGTDLFRNIEHVIDQTGIVLGIEPLRDSPQTQTTESRISNDDTASDSGPVIVILIGDAPDQVVI